MITEPVRSEGNLTTATDLPLSREMWSHCNVKVSHRLIVTLAVTLAVTQLSVLEDKSILDVYSESSSLPVEVPVFPRSL